MIETIGVMFGFFTFSLPLISIRSDRHTRQGEEKEKEEEEGEEGREGLLKGRKRVRTEGSSRRSEAFHLCFLGLKVARGLDGIVVQRDLD